MTASPKVITLAIVALGAVGAWQLRKVFGSLSKAHEAGREAVKPVTDGLYKVWEFVTPKAPGVQSTAAGFVLNEKYILPNGNIKAEWRQAVSAMHPGNPSLFAAITNEMGQIRPEFRHLIGGIVEAESING